jgi:autotransporter adhesin
VYAQVQVGSGATATGLRGVAVGDNSSAGAFTHATAVGAYTEAGADYATAVGQASKATGIGSAAVGSGAQGSGANSSAFGGGAQASGSASTALGHYAGAAGEAAVAVGYDAKANADSSTAIGRSAVANGTGATALGQSSNAGGANATALGRSANAAGENATALGRSANAAGANSAALGRSASAGGAGSVAIGWGSSAPVDNSVALGASSAATRGAQADYTAAYLTAPQNSVGEVSVGSDGGQRQITNVAAGSAPTDAVNVAQLQGAVEPLRADLALLAGRVGALDKRIEDVKDIAIAAGALSMAAAQLRFDDRPGKLSIAAGGAGFHGQGAVAIGMGYTSPDRLWRANIAGSFSDGEAAFGGGLSFTLN